MKKQKLLLLSCIVILQLGYANPVGASGHTGQSNEIKKQIESLKLTEYGREFFIQYSEKDLEHLILFLKNPKRYFSKVQNIGSLWSYIGVYQRFLRETHEIEGSIWGAFLEAHYQNIDKKKLSVLTFLLLAAPPGVSKASFADIYVKFFNSNPGLFVRDLKKREDWKRIVDGLLNYGSSLTMGLNRLSNTAFEIELKTYIDSRKHRP